MSKSPEMFVDVMRQDFNWRNNAKATPKSLSLLGDTIKDTQPYILRPDLKDCKCDVHVFEIEKASVYDMEETMRSIYKTDYNKRDLPITRYRMLMAAIDSPAKSVIIPTVIDLKDAYRDPTRFKSSAMESENLIQPVKTINLLNDKQGKCIKKYVYYTYVKSLRRQEAADDKDTLKKLVLETCSFWDELFTGCSEYIDTISKMGLINMKNQQRYLAPLSVSRKFGNCNSLIKETKSKHIKRKREERREEGVRQSEKDTY